MVRTTVSRAARVALLSLVLVASMGVSMGAVLEQGVVVDVVDENLSITIGQRFTFSTVTVYGDHVEIDGTTMKLSSNTSARLNATLWAFNMTNETDGQDVLRVDAEAGPATNVTFRFTGVPPIGDGNYTLHRDGTRIGLFQSGGTLQWFATNWSRRNHSLVAHIPPEPSGGGGNGGDDDTDDGGGGGGGGGGVFTPTEPDRPGMEPVTREVLVRLLPGESTDVTLRFRNNGTATGAYNVSVEDVQGFLSPNDRTTTLAANETTALPFLVRAPDNASVGVYEGRMRVVWQGGNRSVPVTIIVRSREEQELLDVQMNLLNLDIRLPQADIGYAVDIFNLGGTDRVDIVLYTRILDANGSVVRERSETLAVQTSASIARRIVEDLPPGRYALEVEAVYGNQSAISSASFVVEAEERNLLPFFVAGLLLLTAVLLGGVYAYRRWTGKPVPAGIISCDVCGRRFRSNTAFDIHRNRHRLESVAAAAQAAEEATIEGELLKLSESILEHVHGSLVEQEAFEDALAAAERGMAVGDWEQVERALVRIQELMENHTVR